MMQVIGDVDEVRVKEVEEGEYFTQETVEILTKPKEDGKYRYAIFKVFHIHDLRYLKDVEKGLGKMTGWHDDFTFVGRTPYFSGITIYSNGLVEERY